MYGERAVHDNKDTMDYIHQHAQKIAMKYYGWDREDFIRIFGKNYL